MIEGSCVPRASPVSSNATEDLAFCGCAGIAQRKRAMLAKHARLVIVPKTPCTGVAFSNARLQFARLMARYWCAADRKSVVYGQRVYCVLCAFNEIC